QAWGEFSMQRLLRRRLFLAAAMTLGLAAAARAQTATTGAIAGLVSDPSGGVLPGATIEAVHEPTGTHYSAVSGSEGRVTILNVRAGGPYSVTVSLSGFKEEKQAGVQVALGEERNLLIRLQLESVSETIEVTAAASIINPTNTGPVSNIPQETIDKLPTIGRG